MSDCSILGFVVDVDNLVAGHIQGLVKRVCYSLSLAVYWAIIVDKLVQVAAAYMKADADVKPQMMVKVAAQTEYHWCEAASSNPW